MRVIDTDGNLAALRQYEKEQDYNDTAMQSLLTQIGPMLDKLEELVEDIHYYDDYYSGFDFEEVIDEMIQERIDG